MYDVIIKITDSESDEIAKWFWNECVLNDIDWVNEELKKGFIFNEFKTYYKDQMVIKVRCKENGIFEIKVIGLNMWAGKRSKCECNYMAILDRVAEVSTTNFTQCNGTILEKLGLAFIGYVLTYIMKKTRERSIEMIESETKVKNETKVKKYSSTDKKDVEHVYSLTDCIRKYARKIKGTKHNITCEHWEVRGHYRHYKSGKVVFIKPFDKGRNKDAKVNKKVYTI